MTTASTNIATGGIISGKATAALVFGTDPNSGLPICTLPPVVIPGTPQDQAGANQSYPGDIAVVRAHDVQNCQVIDGTQTVVIDVVPSLDCGTYKAIQGGYWARVDKLLIVAKKSATPPANPTTIAGWYDSVNDNGVSTQNKVPFYQ